MNLPGSRNTTYGANAPILSADLNALQDCVVGMKHPPIELDVPAESFVMLSGGNATLGDGRWTFAAVSVLVAGLPYIPVGTRIVSIEWDYDRGGAGTVTRKLRGRQLIAVAGAQPAAADVTTVADAASAAGWSAKADAPNYTRVAGNQLWLQVQCDNVAHVFGGARITIDRL